jgi:hypothetical protein
MLSRPICSAVMALALVIGRIDFSCGAMWVLRWSATAECDRRCPAASMALASLDINARKSSLGGVLTLLRVVEQLMASVEDGESAVVDVRRGGRSSPASSAFGRICAVPGICNVSNILENFCWLTYVLFAFSPANICLLGRNSDSGMRINVARTTSAYVTKGLYSPIRQKTTGSCRSDRVGIKGPRLASRDELQVSSAHCADGWPGIWEDIEDCPKGLRRVENNVGWCEGASSF